MLVSLAVLGQNRFLPLLPFKYWPGAPLWDWRGCQVTATSSENTRWEKPTAITKLFSTMKLEEFVLQTRPLCPIYPWIKVPAWRMHQRPGRIFSTMGPGWMAAVATARRIRLMSIKIDGDFCAENGFGFCDSRKMTSPWACPRWSASLHAWAAGLTNCGSAPCRFRPGRVRASPGSRPTKSSPPLRAGPGGSLSLPRGWVRAQLRLDSPCIDRSRPPTPVFASEVRHVSAIDFLADAEHSARRRR